MSLVNTRSLRSLEAQGTQRKPENHLTGIRGMKGIKPVILGRTILKKCF